jgi:hypothetical protein
MKIKSVLDNWKMWRAWRVITKCGLLLCVTSLIQCSHAAGWLTPWKSCYVVTKSMDFMEPECTLLVPVAMQSKAWVFGQAFTGIVGSNPTGGIDVCHLWVFVCCQVQVSLTDWSLARRSPNGCGVSECDLETSKRRWPRTSLGCCTTGREKECTLL